MPPRLSKRIKFKDRPDWIKGRYFLFTYPYALFYIIGAGVGYDKTGNLFCLLISGFCGLLFLLLAIGHTIDYYRGVNIESFFVAIPFTISIFVAIFMTAVWALGTTFVSSSIVACGAWMGVVFYFYAVIKDYGDGSHYRANDWVQYRPLSSLGDTHSNSNINNNNGDGANNVSDGVGVVGIPGDEDGIAGDSNYIRRRNLDNLVEEMNKSTW